MNTTTTSKAPDRSSRSRQTTAAPPIQYFQDIDTERLNQNMSALFSAWIPATLGIFARMGTALSAPHFWATQIQYGLDHRLWHADFLGREAMDEERDWLVQAAMWVHWPRIQKALARMREAATEKVARKMKLRRAVALEGTMGHVDAGEGEGEDEIWVEPDLMVWDIVHKRSLKRELKKVGRDEKLDWMRARKDGFRI